MTKSKFNFLVVVFSILIALNTFCSFLFLSEYFGANGQIATIKYNSSNILTGNDVLPSNPLSLSTMSSTYSQEEKVMTLELKATVYPEKAGYTDVTFSIDSVTDCPFTKEDHKEYIELISNGLTCQVKIYKSFLGGTVTVKCESNSINKVSDTCDIKFLGIPETCTVTYNGETSTEENPFIIEEGEEFEVLVDFDNYFSSVGSSTALIQAGVFASESLGLNSGVIGTVKAQATVSIGGVLKTFDFSKALTLGNNNGSFVLSETELLTSFDEDKVYAIESKGKVSFSSSDFLSDITLERNEDNDLIIKGSFKSGYQLDKVNDLYDYNSEIFSEGDYIKWEFDMSEVLCAVGTNFTKDYKVPDLRLAYFRVQGLATDIELSDNEILI